MTTAVRTCEHMDEGEERRGYVECGRGIHIYLRSFPSGWWLVTHEEIDAAMYKPARGRWGDRVRTAGAIAIGKRAGSYY